MNCAINCNLNAYLINERTDTVIRRATENDIPRVLALLSQVLEVHARIRPDIFIPGTTKYGEEDLKAMFLDEKRPVYVAEDKNGNVSGYVMCQLREPPFTSTMVSGRTLFIDDLCVDETVRGQHIGEALFRFAADQARRMGCRDVILNVWEGNDAAKRFYEKMGMRPRETQMELLLTQTEMRFPSETEDRFS